jgi:hypothetical protein
VTRFQVLRAAADRLVLRFEPEVADPAAAFRRTREALRRYLDTQGLGNVQVDYSAAPPLRQARSGKLERVRPDEPARTG